MDNSDKLDKLEKYFESLRKAEKNQNDQVKSQSSDRIQTEQVNVLRDSVKLEEEQVEKLDDLKDYLKRIEDALLGIDKNFRELPKELRYKGPEFSKIQVKEESKTTKESLSEVVGSVKEKFGNLGKSLKDTFEFGKKVIKDPIGAVKEGAKKAGSGFSDVMKAEAGYTAESDRFATERIKQEKSKREAQGAPALTEKEEKDLRKKSREQFRDVVSKEKKLQDVQSKIDESKKYGYQPTEEDILKKNEIIQDISKTKREAGIPDLAPVSKKKLEDEELRVSRPTTGKETPASKDEKSSDESDSTESKGLEHLTNIQEKALEELSLIRKNAEGSITYDKDAAGYRNTSGREVTSKVSGKEIPKGGFMDFETAADRLSGQNERVRKSDANILPERKSSSPSDNPSDISASEEDDNVKSAQEIIADNSKEDLELTKQINSVLKEQLVELKLIKESLTGVSSKNTPPKEEKKAPEAAATEETKPGFELPDFGLGKRAVSRLKSAGSKALSSIKSAGSTLLKFAGSKGGMIAGSALAVGTGAYTAYKGYTGAEEEKQKAEEEINAKLQTGEITPAEAEKEKKQLGEATVEKKGGAIGEGTGMAAGGIVGMKAGAALGATVGSVVPGLGTAVGAGVGAIAGGALGAFAGSKIGKKVGEYGGKAVNALSNFFGGDKNKENEQILKTLPEGARPVKSKDEIIGYTVEGETNIMPVPGKEDKLKEYQQMSQQMVAPAPAPTSTGMTVSQESTAKSDLEREANRPPAIQPIISNNVMNNNTQTQVPVNPRPRMGDGSSALDRYHARIAMY